MSPIDASTTERIINAILTLLVRFDFGSFFGWSFGRTNNETMKIIRRMAAVIASASPRNPKNVYAK